MVPAVSLRYLVPGLRREVAGRPAAARSATSSAAFEELVYI